MSKYRTRTLENALNEVIGKTPVVMIVGPRQVGKSTILNHLINVSKQKINKVSLDNKLLCAKADEDPELFLRTYDTPLLIDEFQNAPNLLNYIKMIVDGKREDEMFHNGEKVGTLYYLTGTRVFETMESVSESLAGRVCILDLFGFSNREINNLKEDIFIPDINLLKKREKTKYLTTNQVFKNIINGSYPEIINENGLNKEQFYETYIRTYIERDVRKLINVKDEVKFIKFISCIAARTGCEYNESDIARDVEVDTKTINSWISILKNTNLVFLLSSYSNNNVQKAIKRPKIYFMDTGLACYLSGYLNADTLEKSAYSGQIFETYIISEIIKSYTNNGIDPKKRLYYYRDTNGCEIDLLINYDNTMYPIEIKKSANPGNNAIKNFSVVSKFSENVGTGIVLCMTKDIIAIDKNNYFVPIEYI